MNLSVFDSSDTTAIVTHAVPGRCNHAAGLCNEPSSAVLARQIVSSGASPTAAMPASKPAWPRFARAGPVSAAAAATCFAGEPVARRLRAELPLAAATALEARAGLPFARAAVLQLAAAP